MGCSPSKGKLFSKPENPGSLLADASQEGIDSTPAEEDRKCLMTDEKENENLLPTEEHPTEETPWSQLTSNTMSEQNAEDIKDVVQADETKKTAKIKNKKGKRRSSAKQRSSIHRAKLHFSPHMVRAHQAAYAFLNPNISKYDILLGLLDHATQTQLSLQPMMSALVLRFEEINQALEEMAEEGELMLKEHGDYMALPSGMMGPANMQFNTNNPRSNPPDPPPDLLQQLLQHSTEKMRVAGSSVQALGDTTLEEAIEYYSSLSKLLLEKMQTKQAVEQRLAQVLARVEAATMKKCNPEDSALHSEDSGIGGENESVTGYERHRHHRGSAGSGSCGSGINIRGALDYLPSNSSNLLGHNENDQDDAEEYDDDDEYGDDDGDRPTRKRSNSSPPDPTQSLLYTCANYIKDQQSTVKRPMTAVTATTNEHSSFINHKTIMMELQSNQRDLDLGMKKMTEVQVYKELAGPHYNLYSAGQRRHSLSGSDGAQKHPLRERQAPCCLPTLAPHPPNRHFVKRLISTFSQGVDGRHGQSLANIAPHIRRPQKSGTLLLSDTVNGNESSAIINGNNNHSLHDGRDVLDVDNLPPPPPEVLMDSSFQSTDGIKGNEGRSQEDLDRSFPRINQNSRVSQRLRASVQNVEVLPSRASLRQRSISILPAHPVRQDAVMGLQDQGPQPETDLDPDMEKANCLYQQARKIIHLRNAAESHDQRNIAELSSRGLSPIQTRRGQKCDSNDFFEGEMSSCNLRVTAPPVSRVRLPPSCPSVYHMFPNPPVLRPQTISGPSSRPGSPRMVTRAVDNITEEIIPSVSFRDARSVFCVNEPQNISGHSVFPKPWEEACRGRLP